MEKQRIKRTIIAFLSALLIAAILVSCGGGLDPVTDPGGSSSDDVITSLTDPIVHSGTDKTDPVITGGIITGTQDDPWITLPPVTLPPVTQPPVTLPPVTDPTPPEDDPEIPDQTGVLTISTDALYNDFKFSAPRGALYDMTDDSLLLSKGMFDRINPASTTKILTALFARTFLPLDEVITVGDELSRVASDASVAGIKRGEKYTFEQLMYGMMLCSGNDSAYTIAAHGGRVLADNMDLDTSSAIELFMEGVNEYCKSLGMTGTNFAVPDGYTHSRHYTTLYDMLIATKRAIDDEVIIKITSSPFYIFMNVSGKLCSYVNRNLLINPESEYHYPNVIGMKTGTTSAAGNCIIAVAKRSDGHIIVSAVFGAKQSAGRYEEAAKLLDYAGCR